MYAIPVFLLLLPCALAAGDPACLPVNSGFEEASRDGLPAGWSGAPAVYQRDATVAKEGEAALRCSNTDSALYGLCSQSLSLQTGRMYEVSAWIRTQGVHGDESGATVCIEWRDEQGQYLGGCYPSGVKGDSDWTLVKGLTPRIPDNARSFSLSCYFRKGITGVAWWDSVALELVREVPMSAVLVVPNYRGEVTDDSARHATIRTEVRLRDYAMKLVETELAWTISPAGEVTTVASGRTGPLEKEVVDLAIPVRRLEPGTYTIGVALKNRRSAEVLAKQDFEIARVKDTSSRAVNIDEHNRLIVDGNPFFPLGMYWGGIDKDQLAVYAESPFNCLMPYGAPAAEQMDLIQAHGLKVIYSVKDIYSGTKFAPQGIQNEEDEYAFIKAKAEAFKGHPALLAWYINDELPPDMVERLARHRDWMEQLDPGHPAWVVLYQVDRVRDYISTFDVIGTDPYPIPEQSTSMAGDWTRKTVQAVAAARPIWQVPQVFNWACYKDAPDEKARNRTPTYDEMRSMAWQCIAEGANGLIFYSWFDIRRDPATPFEQQWARVKKMAQEVADATPVLLSVENPPRIDLPQEPWLHTLVKKRGRETWLFLVNNSHEPHTIKATLPDSRRNAVRVDGGAPLTVERRRFACALSPLDVAIVRITR